MLGQGGGKGSGGTRTSAADPGGALGGVPCVLPGDVGEQKGKAELEQALIQLYQEEGGFFQIPSDSWPIKPQSLC